MHIIRIRRKQMKTSKEQRNLAMAEINSLDEAVKFGHHSSYWKHYAKGRKKQWEDVIKGKIQLSDKRKANLEKAFPEIKWDFNSAICINPGIIGDKPQFSVTGSWKYFTFVYTWASPGGGQSNLKIFNMRGKKVWGKHPAPFIEAKEIWKHILQVVLN